MAKKGKTDIPNKINRRSGNNTESYYRTIFEQSPDGILVIDTNGKIIDFNEAASDRLGYSREEFSKLSISDIDSSETPEETRERIRNILKDGRAEFEVRHRTKKGETRDTLVITQVINLGGRIVFNSVWKDITDQKVAAEALQESEKRYRLIAENTYDMITRHLPDSTYLYVSPACRKLFGYKPEELIGKKAFDFMHPEDRKRIIHITQEAIRTGGSDMGQYRHLKKDGQYVWVETTGKVIKNNSTGAIEDIICVVRDITEHKQAEELLRKEKDRVRRYLDIARVILLAIDVEQKVTLINRKGCEVLGYTEQEIIGKNWFDSFVPAGFREKVKDTFVKLMSGKVEAVEYFENPVLTKSGAERLIAWHNTMLKDGAGNIIGTLSSGEDITERNQAAEALCQSEAELHDNYFAQATINMILSESLENIPLEEILQKALNMILSVPWIAFEPIGNIQLVEDYQQQKLVMKAQSNMPEAVQKAGVSVSFGQCLCGKAALTQQMQFTDRDECYDVCHEGMFPYGHYAVPVLFSGRTLGVLNIFLKEGHVRSQKEEDFLRTVADTLAGIITRKQAEDRIEYLAYYDNLTGLPNRNLFIDRLTQGIARAEYGEKLVAILTIDIDRFKSINDTYGLNAGDAVLKEIAERLSQTVRDGDTVARLGNDDFGVLLIDIAQSEDIILVVEKIMENASQPVFFNEKEITLTICVGISAYPTDGKDAQALIKNADLAFVKAKQQGRKNYQFYTEGLDVKASEFVLMEKNLFNAIKNDEFILHYQPYWDISTKKIAGMEALIRWKSPASGLILPGKFIPVLEDTRMIIEVGEWIVGTAIRQVKDWQDKGYPAVPVSVNLSLIQFRQKDLSHMIERTIRENGLSPSLLTLEITESAFMQDIEFTYSVLERLKSIGVSISIDDFGTGYSSLAHLKRFPVDNLKIDMSFIREIAADADTASIVTAIIAMAHTLNLKTIAEGIETEEQWKILRLLRCDMGQGFYLSRPLSAEDMEKLFRQE